MSKKRFRCRIGLHDWQRLDESEHACDGCWKCTGEYRPCQRWDKVCIAPGCRATHLTATDYRAGIQRAKELKADRAHLAKLKLELIKAAGVDLISTDDLPKLRAFLDTD